MNRGTPFGGDSWASQTDAIGRVLDKLIRKTKQAIQDKAPNGKIPDGLVGNMKSFYIGTEEHHIWMQLTSTGAVMMMASTPTEVKKLHPESATAEDQGIAAANKYKTDQKNNNQAAMQADLAAIAAAEDNAVKAMGGAKERAAPEQAAFIDISRFRTELGRKAYTSGRSKDVVIARLDIDGNTVAYGIDGWVGSKTYLNADGKVRVLHKDKVSKAIFLAAGFVTPNGTQISAPTTNHAEADTIFTAFTQNANKRYNSAVGILYVDAPLCSWCKSNINNLRLALGLDKLTVYVLVDGKILSHIFP